MKPTHPLQTYALRNQRKDHASLMSDSWATSFSDLVTLLLCFFLTMISFGPMGKPPSQPVVKVSNTPGISLALEGDGVQRRTFGLTQDELFRGNAGEQPQALNELISSVVSGGYQNKRISVTVSPEVQSEERGARWMSIIQRLSGIHRQLVDAAPGAQVLLKIAHIKHNDSDYVAVIDVEDLGK